MLKSWDIFDTLIARRCIHPHNIFRIVEQVTKLENFTALRIKAERNLIDRGINYNFDDIYKEFGKITNAPEKLCAELKALEIKVELDQCMPITENLRQVKAGDILISDMYLPEKVIRKMLDKAGLFAPVEILITSGGKSSGKIWKELSKTGQFLFHIGDNVESDVQKPRQYGFDTALSVLSQPNQFEQWLLQRDFQFGSYLREIRLRNPFTEENKRNYWTLFTLNIGLLIVCVQLMDELQKKYGFEYLGFCGRDTYYLWLLYKKYKEDMGEEPPDNAYLHYSRKLAHYSRQDLIKYFNYKIAGRKALMIDLLGTGRTLHLLRKDTVLNYSILLCYHQANRYTDPQKRWVALSDSSVDDDSFSFINYSSDTLPLNDNMDVFNRATHNSPVRMYTLRMKDKNIFQVNLSEINDTENFDVIEACLKEVLKSKIVYSRFKGDEAIENLQQMLQIFTKLAIPVVMMSRHVINEAMDKMGFLSVLRQYPDNQQSQLKRKK